MTPGPRLVLAGGGTGGHIYPLLALAQELQQREPTATVHFIGEAQRMEAELVPQAGSPTGGSGRPGGCSARCRPTR